MYQLCFYVPLAAADQVKTAVFAAGAGAIGDYENCCWQTLGQGQFKPLLGAQPAIGCVDQLEIVAEIKVEMVCEKSFLAAAVQALIEAHPYEEPAYHIVSLQSLSDIFGD